MTIEFFQAQYVRGGIYAIDGTEILVGEAKTFEGTGTITVPVRHKDGRLTYATKTGYKLIYLLNLKPDREFVVSYRLVPLNTHALQVVREKGFEGLTTWSSCSLPLNGILRLRDEKTLEQAHGLVTTLPVQEAIRIDRQYGARWGIENDGNRELKQGWDLEILWGRTLAAVTLSVVIKLLGFNYVKLFHTRTGSRLIARGMRRLPRARLFTTKDKRRRTQDGRRLSLPQ